MAYRGAYPAMTPREIDDMMAGQCYQADQIVMPGERVKIFCGVPLRHFAAVWPYAGADRHCHPGQSGVPGRRADERNGDARAKMPSAVCRADDLKAKASLRALRCDAYVLAHRGVYSDIGDLIENNIAYILDRAELVYDCLQGEMSEEEWVRAVYRRLDMHSTKAFKCAVCERNMRSFIDYLADGGPGCD